LKPFVLLILCSSVFVEILLGYSPSSSHLGPFKWYRSRGHRSNQGITTFGAKYGSSCVQPCGGKPPFFDGSTSFDHWKRKMKQHLGSINDKVWEVTEHDYVIIDPNNLTPNDRINKQCVG
jgi:hypothetical protein